MIIYILILLFVLFLWLVTGNKLGKIDIILFVLLTIVSGLRYGVGTDYFNYVRIFDTLKLGYEVTIEPGFTILTYVLSSFNLNSQALFLLLAIITMTFLYKGLKYYTAGDQIFKPVLYIIMLLFVFIPSLNVVRQVLSAVIILYASRYIIEKNIIRYLIWVFIAALFHSSSFIFIFLYFIVGKNFKKISLFSVLILSVLIANLEVITNLLNYILDNFAFLDVNNYISNYLNTSYIETEVEFGFVTQIHIFVLILFIILKDRLVTNAQSLVAFNFFFLYIISIILSVDAYVFNRFNYYFGIYMAISIASFSKIFDEDSKKIVNYIMLGLYTVLYLYYIFITPGHNMLPYNFNLNLFN